MCLLAPAQPLANAPCTALDPLHPVSAFMKEEGAKAGKAREAMAAKLQQLEKQRGDVERTRDEFKVIVCWW